jgi:hypothetical protein
MCRYGLNASRTLLFSVSTMIFSLRSRRRAYHDAVSSNSEPPSTSLSTFLLVRPATSATLMLPILLVSPRARSCKPSQISRKNYIGNDVSGVRVQCHTEMMRNLPHRRSSHALPVRDSLRCHRFCKGAQDPRRQAAFPVPLW